MRNVGRSIGELVTLLQDLRPQRPPIFPRYDDLYHCHLSLQVRSYPLSIFLSLFCAIKRANDAVVCHHHHRRRHHLHTARRQGDREKVVSFIRQLPPREEAAQVMALLEQLEADLPVRSNPPLSSISFQACM